MLDKAIEDAVEAIKPEHVIFVSDHGAAPYEYTMCVNSWLEQRGYLKRGLGDRGLKQHAIKAAKALLPKQLKKNLKKSGPAYLKNNLSAFDPKRTRAFGPERIPGIYINDERFIGVVPDQASRDALVDELITNINADPQFQERGITAYPYRREAEDGPFQSMMPDIGFAGAPNFWSQEYGPLFADNPNYVNLPESIAGLRNPNSGVKGRNALFVTDAALAAHVKDNDKKDLTLVYKVFARAFGLPA